MRSEQLVKNLISAFQCHYYHSFLCTCFAKLQECGNKETTNRQKSTEGKESSIKFSSTYFFCVLMTRDSSDSTEVISCFHSKKTNYR